MRIEQKTLLIYGNMITATLGELASNDSIVRAIRAELLEQEPFDETLITNCLCYTCTTLMKRGWATNLMQLAISPGS